MSNKLSYFFGKFIAIPLLPFLYFQGKNIRKKVPKLPEAKEPKGFVNGNFKNTLHLLAIGESTIAGVGVDFHKNGFTGALANTLSIELQSNINWRVYARSGYTVQKVCKKIIPKIEEKTTDLIVIGMGGNDAFTLNSPKKWMLAIEELIHLIQIKFPETPLFFANMPPIKEFPAFTKPIKFVIGNLVELLGERLHIVVKSKPNVFCNNEVITLNTWSKKHNLPTNNSKIYFSDGVHPSELTYKIWGKDMGLFIKANIKEQQLPLLK